MVGLAGGDLYNYPISNMYQLLEVSVVVGRWTLLFNHGGVIYIVFLYQTCTSY